MKFLHQINYYYMLVSTISKPLPNNRGCLREILFCIFLAVIFFILGLTCQTVVVKFANQEGALTTKTVHLLFQLTRHRDFCRVYIFKLTTLDTKKRKCIHVINNRQIYEPVIDSTQGEWQCVVTLRRDTIVDLKQGGSSA